MDANAQITTIKSGTEKIAAAAIQFGMSFQNGRPLSNGPSISLIMKAPPTKAITHAPMDRRRISAMRKIHFIVMISARAEFL